MDGVKRSFTVVWISQTLVIFSVVLAVFTAGIVAYQQTDSLITFSVVILCGYVPELLVMPLAGPMVDRLSRRTILLACCLGQCAVFSAYWVVLTADALDMAHVYLVLSVSSLLGGVHRLAYNASLVLFTDNSRHYPKMNGAAQAGLAMAHIIAPLVAGAVLTVSQSGWVAVVAALSCLVAGLALARVDFPELPAPAPAVRRCGDMRTGLRFIAQVPGLALFLFMHAFSNMARGAAIVLFTPFILTFASEATLGTLRSVAGIGMALGAGLMVVWGGPARRLRGVIVSLGLCGLFMSLIGTTQSATMIGLATFALFLATPVLAALAHAIWQLRVPVGMQGRVFGVRDSLAGAALALGYVASPWVASVVFEPLAGSRADAIAALYMVLGALTLALATFAARQRAIRALDCSGH